MQLVAGECKCPKTKYLKGTSCNDCDSSCAECSGGSSKECTACNPPLILESDGSCLCQFGSYLNSGVCKNCLEAPTRPPNCPYLVTVSLPRSVQELTQILTIDFEPSFSSQNLPASHKVTSERLLEKHLKLTFTRNDESTPRALKILEKNLTQSTQKSTLSIRHLQKMRVSNTKSIDVQLTQTVYYQSADLSKANEGSVLKNPENTSISITKPERTATEKILNITSTAVNVGLGLATTTGVIASGVLTACYLDKLGIPVLIYFVRLFNILDILSNISKINLEFSDRLQHAMNFINSLQLPVLNILEKFSILDDEDYNGKDVDAYSLLTHGSRGKMTSENADIFLSHGQNFAVSIMIVLLRIAFVVLRGCLQQNSRLLNWISYFYHLLVGVEFL